MACARFGLFAFCVALAWSAHPCSVHDGVPAAELRPEPASPKALAPLWVGPAFSGSWYTPERSGEGFTLQILDSGRALALWFTFPPAGSAAAQAWIYAEGGRIEGDRIRFEGAFTTRGPRFGAGYDPAALQVIAWGTLEFRFLDCNRGELSFSGPAGWGSGTRSIERLTSLSELECGGKRRLTASGARALAGLRQKSGAWFDPSHNGEGWNLEELPDGRTQVYWFTYDERGEQAWTIGVAPAGGEAIEVAANLRPVGTRFGAGFDPAAIRIEPWGRLSLAFSSCDAASATYASSQPAFGSGTLRPVRLTRLAGAACVDGNPAAPASGQWSEGAAMPRPQSEHAIATVGTRSCIVGGLGAPRDLKCYDVATGAWTAHAEAPVGRDHGLAWAHGGDLFMTGGYASDLSEGQSVTGWRYRMAQDRWEPVPQLPNVAASGTAMLDGFVYLGHIDGSLRQVDPATLASRRIPQDNVPGRDHSQLVAFQGELWLIGGRDAIGAQNARVSIYDPASETWRAGPAMRSTRGGFAAAANASHLIVAGGEWLGNPRRVLNNVEAIAAGEDAWTILPPLPYSMHGFTAAIHGNALYALGGSRQPGIARNEGQVQVYRWGP